MVKAEITNRGSRTGLRWMLVVGLGGAAVGCEKYTCMDTASCPKTSEEAGVDTALNPNLGADASVTSDTTEQTGALTAVVPERTSESPKDTAAETAENNTSETERPRTEHDETTDSNPATVGWEEPETRESSPTSAEGAGEMSTVDEFESEGDGGTAVCAPTETRPCFDVEGNCADGVQTCENGTWSECSIIAQAHDTCEAGDDADCDGEVNEGCDCAEGSERYCSEANLQGPCAAGVQTCKPDGSWSACSITPATEDSCDTPQNDANCDGTLNGGCSCLAGDSQNCGPANVGICKSGSSHCVDGQYSLECEGAVTARARDCRSADDNNCDGSPDNTVDGTCQCVVGRQEDCNTHPGDGNGPCRPGKRTCLATADGSTSYWGSCTGDIGPQNSDSCVTINDDSNCNGEMNDSCDCISGDTTSCADEYASRGVCGARSLTCSVSGRWPAKSTCDALASAEMCTGNLDEDCDGSVNEIDACPCAAAPCQHNGQCSANGSNYTCNCSNTGYTGTNCELPIGQSFPLPTNETVCYLVGISTDGTTIGADCDGAPYYWTVAGGWEALRLSAGNSPSILVGMSANGQVFAGNNGPDGYPNRWTSPGANNSPLSSGSSKDAVAISGDGTRIVGVNYDVGAFVWDNANAPVTWQQNATLPDAQAEAISGDGRVIYGGAWQPGFVKWTAHNASTAVTVADSQLVVTSVNQDGTIVGGYGSNTDVFWYRPWVYKNNQLTYLNTNGVNANCYGEAMSNDGTRVVGMCEGVPTYWTNGTMKDVETYLIESNADIGALTARAEVVTPDGKIIAGGSGGVLFIVRLP